MRCFLKIVLLCLFEKRLRACSGGATDTEPIMDVDSEMHAANILVVDDNEAVGRLICEMLGVEGYACIAVDSAESALDELNRREYSLVVSDINMPGLDGIELLKRIRDLPNSEIAVIMVTVHDELGTAIRCLKLGAYDYLVKPVEQRELCFSVVKALERLSIVVREKDYQEALKTEVVKKTVGLRRTIEELKDTKSVLGQTQKEIIYRLAVAAEYRDEDTGEHLFRIAGTSFFIAEAMGLEADFCATIHAASPLHDIGKIGISDSILLKPGPLDDEERELMKTHTLIGRKILQNSKTALIQMACEIAETHHENFDGNGYPYGRRGDEIPLSARIVGVADVFDALASKRPYKEAWSFEDSRNCIVEKKGTQFDPQVVDAFSSCAERIYALRKDARNFLSTGEGLPAVPEINFGTQFSQVAGLTGFDDRSLQ